MPRAEYSQEQREQAKAAVLITGSLDKGRELLLEAWDCPPPAKDTLARWNRDPSILPDASWAGNMQIERVETIRVGVMEMFDATKRRYLDELPDMSWNDVQHANFALGIIMDKILGRPCATNVNIDARQAHLYNGNGP